MSSSRNATALLCVLLVGCTENVAFLSLDISAPVWSPSIVCSDDPRRATALRVSVSCGEDETSESFDLEKTRVALSNVPLGDACTIEVVASNASGRAVAIGTAQSAIVQGDNEPLELPLVETECDLSCDADGDGLAEEDEQALGLNPSLKDTDRDGLNDGLEVLQCCSDPLARGGKCALLIESVMPPLGVVGDPVVVKASTELELPTNVTIGDIPLDIAVIDLTTVFGRVAEGSVLGPVTLRSGKNKQQHQALFAVLRDKPEAIYTIDQRAGATSGLLQDVVDVVSIGQLLLLLGQPSSSNSSGAAAGEKNGVALIAIDRSKAIGNTSRAVLSATGRPLALGAAANAAAALFTAGNETTLLVLKRDGPSSEITASPIKLKRPASTFTFEPDGKAVQLLHADGVGRIDLESAKQLFFPFAFATSNLINPDKRDCTGIAYDGKKDHTYLACNFAPRQCNREDCLPLGTLLRFGPTRNCLQQALDNNTGKNEKCWAAFIAPGPHPLIGAPIVDQGQQLVYVLSTVGVGAAPLGEPKPIGALRLHIPFAWQGALSLHPMVLTSRGELFVAAGPIVQRFDPRPDLKDRYGRPFIVGDDGHAGLIIAADPAGSALEVIRHKLTTEHMTVCLARCPSCPCR